MCVNLTLSQLTILATTPVIATEFLFLYIGFRLAGNTQTYSRDGFSTSLGYLGCTFFAVFQTFATGQLTAYTLHGIFDTGIDLILHSTVFGPATWYRALIKPGPGHALAYIDYEQQEFAMAAHLSQDPKMIAAYASGDVYLAFANPDPR